MGRRRAALSPLYYPLAAVSGCLWAGIAYALGHAWFGRWIWFGVAASPAIGVFVGWLHRPVYGYSWRIRGLVALLTLYLGAALFGLAMGLANAAHPVPNRVPWAPVGETVLAVWWGLTFSGFVAVLWPLAIANHSLLGRIHRAPA